MLLPSRVRDSSETVSPSMLVRPVMLLLRPPGISQQRSLDPLLARPTDIRALIPHTPLQGARELTRDNICLSPC